MIDDKAKKDIIEDLQEKVMNIDFTKKDGTLRKMKATLQKKMLPKATKKNSLSQKKVRETDSDKVLAVWDVDKKAWRSFRWDTVIGVSDVA